MMFFQLLRAIRSQKNDFEAAVQLKNGLAPNTIRSKTVEGIKFSAKDTSLCAAELKTVFQKINGTFDRRLGGETFRSGETDGGRIDTFMIGNRFGIEKFPPLRG